ncbi:MULTISPECIES: hypothetical protein [Thermoactinomyces]|jgi:hypothetical protein|uniref:Uncharacterized protein n=1 Tax=Thermoactinomyces daqus TaxID=1329516 RepID=A0A7W1XC11_9BACL|nr:MULTISPECIES: hypothetical protein [Thermoactinomyces]MBA4543891.1 hypothetical protein [Thermoactinomyces daqus]MBH8599368.1 hypothetical protein [Thermoactinomyces sp. CICC 10523]MBH8608310.1 hypothetical protein [Thermoactinomyces sp. CICC 10521]
MSENKQGKRGENNHPQTAKVQKGEHKNGRLSQFKNHHPEGEPYPSEYLSRERD